MSIFASWQHKWFFVPNTLSEKTSVGYPLSAWIDPAWKPYDLEKIIKYLNNAPIYTYTIAFDVKCALCNQEIEGSTIERWDGTWLWGNVDCHYVQFHSVRLPDLMVEHIRRMDYAARPIDISSQELAEKRSDEFFESLEE
jgi:hypothetical protein